MVPYDIDKNQLKKRVNICRELFAKRRTLNWLNNLITGDEKLILYVNNIRKKQWLKPGQSAKPTAKPMLHPKKRMISVWWNTDGIFYWELLPEKATVNAARYCLQLNNMAANLKKQGLERRKIYFQHDNSKPHTADKVKKKK